MDNAAEFFSRAFNDYCMALGIQVQHSVPYVHTQNGLAESLIKRVKLIARPLLQNCNLPTSCWGHTVLHAVDLIQLRPTAYHATSPLQLVRGNTPNISHLRKFGCVVYCNVPPLRGRTRLHLAASLGYRLPSQTNTGLFCALCPHSCAPGKNFPVGHPSLQAKHA